jgi:hypothetical protein
MRALVFLLVSLGTSLGLVALYAHQRTLFLPGTTTPGHHQIEARCELCHLGTSTGTSTGVSDAACRSCHDAALDAADDLHPRAKFLDPRNADLIQRLDARRCVTCHVEHRPALAERPRDFCRACHASVGDEVASHRELPFTSCQDAGCHRFHDNRALRPAFLRRHLQDPDTQPVAHINIPAITHPLRPARPPVDLPVEADPTIAAAWQQSAHARANVGCIDCHGDPWVAHPTPKSCTPCHAPEVAGFEHSRHGMRISANLPPMTPKSARVPTSSRAARRELNCSTCHDPHTVDTTRAATDACLACHADRHSLAFPSSPHARPELNITCATCHLPRLLVPETGAVGVEHDQDRTLSPREAMLRPVCEPCHGAPFALSALIDDDLIDTNFAHAPARRAPALEMLK